MTKLVKLIALFSGVIATSLIYLNYSKNNFSKLNEIKESNKSISELNTNDDNILYYSAKDLTKRGLTYLKNGKYKISNLENNNPKLDVIVECRHGGQPLAFWGVEADEIVDSQVDLKPLYVKESYLASSLSVADFIKLDTKEKNNLHTNPKNPSHVGTKIHFKNENNTPFYIATAGFPPVLSYNSNQTVSAYKIDMFNVVEEDYLNSNNLRNEKASFKQIRPHEEIINNIPHPNHSFIGATHFLVYRVLDEIHTQHFAWDQLIGWSNYFEDNRQDLYYSIGAYDAHEEEYYGKGFVMCGSDTEPQLINENDDKEFKEYVKKSYEMRNEIRGNSYITKIHKK